MNIWCFEISIQQRTKIETLWYLRHNITIRIWNLCGGDGVSSVSTNPDLYFALVIVVQYAILQLRCRYNAVSFLKNLHKIHSIARPIGRGMGRLLWIETLIYILSLSVQCCVQYHLVLDRVITAPYCIMHLWLDHNCTRLYSYISVYQNAVISQELHICCVLITL